MRTAICLTGDDMHGGVGQVGTIMHITSRRSSVGILHLFCPVEEGSIPRGGKRPTEHPKNPFVRKRERESGAQWEEGRKKERERERAKTGGIERERGGERPTEQELGTNRHCGRVVGSS